MILLVADLHSAAFRRIYRSRYGSQLKVRAWKEYEPANSLCRLCSIDAVLIPCTEGLLMIGLMSVDGHGIIT